MTRQLALDIGLTREPLLEDFIAGPNAEALACVKAWAKGGPEPYIYLWGERGSGKTHLAMAALRCAKGQGADGLYLDLNRHRELDAAMLQGLEQLDLICLDAVQAVTGNASWEIGLFNLFNRLRDTGKRLLATGDSPASELPLQLPDLSSRLSWGPGYRLRPLDDPSRLQLLQHSATTRGMQLSTAAARYILNHYPRDLHSLETLLDCLDRLSLAEKKKPGIPVIRQAMDVLQGAEEEE